MAVWVVRTDPPSDCRVVADRVYVDDGVLKFVERDWGAGEGDDEGDDEWLTVAVFGRDEWLRVYRDGSESAVVSGDRTFGEVRRVLE